MPEVNFNLLNPGAELYSGPQVTLDPVKAYETAQAKQQSNMLAQLYAKHYDPQTGGVNYNSLIGEAAQSGLGKYIPDIMGDAQKQAQSQATLAKTAAETESTTAEAGVRKQTALEKKIGNARTAYESIYIPTDAELQTPEGKAAYNKAFNSFLNLHEDIHSDPDFQKMYIAKGGNKDDAYSQIMATYGNPNAFRQLLMTAQMGTKDTLAALDAQAGRAETERAHRASEKTAEGNLAVSRAREQREAENQIRANDPQFQASLAEAKKRGELIAAGDVSAIQTLPATIQKAESALNVIDQMIGKRIQATDKDGKKLTNPDGSPKYIPDTPENANLYNKGRHAGFSNAVGAGIPFASSVPGTETANFSSMHDQVTSQAFLQAYETLRGTGSIATKEGEKATAAITRMNKSQSEDEYVKAAREFQDSVQKMIDNAKKKAATAQGKINPVKVPGKGTKDDPYRLD